MHNVKRERPITHDLCKSIIVAMGATLRRVEITHVENNTYIAELHLERNGAVVRVDSRPSDAIAIAVRLDAPIFAAEDLAHHARRRRRRGRDVVQPADRARRERRAVRRAAEGVSRAFAPRGFRQVQSVIVALSLLFAMLGQATDSAGTARRVDGRVDPWAADARSNRWLDNGSCCTASDTIGRGRSTPCARDRTDASASAITRRATRPRSTSRRRRSAASCIPRRPSARRSYRATTRCITVFDTTSGPVAIKIGGRHLIVGAPNASGTTSDRRGLRSRERQHRHGDREG